LEITIHVQGSDNDVTIFGNPLGVEFDTDTYSDVTSTTVGHKHRNPDEKAFINRVDVTAGDFSFQKNYKDGALCRVEANRIAAKQKRGKRKRSGAKATRRAKR